MLNHSSRDGQRGPWERRPVRRRIIRAVLLVLSAIFFVAGIVGVATSVSWYRESLARGKACWAEFDVDLSTPGIYNGQIAPGNWTPEGEIVGLQLGPSEDTVNWPDDLFAGLEMSATITDTAGTELLAFSIPMDDSRAGVSEEGWTNLTFVRPVPRGQAHMTVTVTSGATQLKGVRQRIVVRPMECGLVRVVSLLGGVLSALVSIVGLAVGSAFLVRLRHRP